MSQHSQPRSQPPSAQDEDDLTGFTFRSKKQLRRRAKRKIESAIESVTPSKNVHIAEKENSTVPHVGHDISTNENESNSNETNNSDAEAESEVNDGELAPTASITTSNETSRDFLRNWAIKNKITHTSLSELLTWLSSKPDLRNLPHDARTLLNTPKSVAVEPMGDGQFYYFGSFEPIKQFVNSCEKLKICVKEQIYILLDFNIDGLPIYKSRKTSFWPILCRCSINDVVKGSPFPVALYYGQSKPPLLEFFQKFVTEMSEILKHNFHLGGKKMSVKINSLCCDTPAKAYVLNTKGHNGYHGCGKCAIKGEYINRRMTFWEKNSPLREDEVFAEVGYPNHQKGITPLSRLGMLLVSEVPVDYMHAVCLGIQRKLLFIWRDGPRQSRIKVVNYEKKLATLKMFWPHEFNRVPRTFSELEHWKATEYRSFLLYYGPILLKNEIPPNLYKHFLLLNFGIRILLSKKLNTDYNSYADDLLKSFVNYSKVYGEEFCTYNTHSLTHLAQDAQNYGSLENVNCFAFENFLGFLKSLLKKSTLPLQQIIHRMAERRYIDDNKIVLTANRKCKANGKPVSVCEQFDQDFEGIFYKSISFNELKICTNKGDNCVSVEGGDIVLIKYIGEQNGDFYIFCHKLIILRPFTLYPADSTFMSMYEVRLPDEDGPTVMLKFPTGKIEQKYVLLPYENNFFCCPFLHDQ